MALRTPVGFRSCNCDTRRYARGCHVMPNALSSCERDKIGWLAGKAVTGRQHQKQGPRETEELAAPPASPPWAIFDPPFAVIFYGQ